MSAVKVTRRFRDLKDVVWGGPAEGDIVVYDADSDELILAPPAGGSDPAKVDKDSVVAAATRVVANKLLAGDAQPTLRVLGSGKVEWGTGGAAAPDVNLQRLSNGTLGVSGVLVASELLATVLLRSGEDVTAARSVYLDTVEAGGQRLWFGASADTSLYRSGAGELKTDGSFEAFSLKTTGDILANAGENEVRLGTGIIYWGIAADTNLFRSAPGVLKTTGTLDAAALTINDVPVGPTIPGFRTGQSWFYFPAGGQVAGTPAQNALTTVPIWLPAGLPIDRLVVDTTGNGGVGSVIRLGLYADTGWGMPGALIVDAGTFVAASGNGVGKTLTVSVTIPTSGWYWLAYAAQGGTPPALRCIDTNSLGGGYSWSSLATPIGATEFGGYTVTAAGALPNPFGTPTVYTSNPARVYIRVP